MRYFTDTKGTVWRYDGKTLEGRTVTMSAWAESYFNSPTDLIESLNDITEIPEP